MTIKECPPANYLALHLPLTQETKGIVNPESLSWMELSAATINISRGDRSGGRVLTLTHVRSSTQANNQPLRLFE
jgi:hypothetical protein